MYVVFTDPYYKEIRFFEGVGPSEENTNGHYVDFTGNLDFLISELMLIGMISLAGNGTYIIRHKRYYDSPNKIIDSIKEICLSVFISPEHIYKIGGIYDPIKKQMRDLPQNRELIGHREVPILGKLIQVAETYGDAVADLEIAIKRSPDKGLFKENYIDTSVLDSNDIWTSIVHFDNGTLYLMIEGIGSGKLFTWPRQLKSCSEIRCSCGNVRHKLESANHVYRQIELLIYKLEHVLRNLTIPTTVTFNVNERNDYLYKYREGWQLDQNVARPRHLHGHDKTLKMWSEFKPTTEE